MWMQEVYMGGDLGKCGEGGRGEPAHVLTGRLPPAQLGPILGGPTINCGRHSALLLGARELGAYLQHPVSLQGLRLVPRAPAPSACGLPGVGSARQPEKPSGRERQEAQCVSLQLGRVTEVAINCVHLAISLNSHNLESCSFPVL